MQCASHILMVRPAAFGYNRQTAATNGFQTPSGSLTASVIQEKALEEFDEMVRVLLRHDINVLIAEDTENPVKPDAIFPNNWFCTNTNGVVSVFPMHVPNRRMEKRDDILLALSKRFEVKDVVDWTEYEAEGFYLEGNGSMVMDHNNKIIYASLSERTHPNLLQKFARYHGFKVIAINATDEMEVPVYYTNMMMTVGDGFTIICETAIKNEIERIAVVQLLLATGHTIIPISLEQMQQFAGNILQVENAHHEKCIVLSKNAFNSLTREQIKKLQGFGNLVPVHIPTIESVGGGSVRCMMAEIFLQEKK